jgi:homeobox domain-containing protein
VQDLVGEALMRLSYSSDLILSARGCIVIRNWKPLPTEKVADGPLLTVGDILAELINLATLKIQVYRSRPPPPTPAAEVRDKLLRLLLLRSHAVLIAAGCPLDEVRRTHWPGPITHVSLGLMLGQRR